MVSEVVIGVRDAERERDAPPELPQITLASADSRPNLRADTPSPSHAYESPLSRYFSLQATPWQHGDDTGTAPDAGPHAVAPRIPAEATRNGLGPNRTTLESFGEPPTPWARCFGATRRAAGEGLSRPQDGELATAPRRRRCTRGPMLLFLPDAAASSESPGLSRKHRTSRILARAGMGTRARRGGAGPRRVDGVRGGERQPEARTVAGGKEDPGRVS